MLVKEKEPGRTISLTETSQAIETIQQMIVVGNSVIAKHNAMVDNYTAEKNILVSAIWTFLLYENEALISGYLNNLSNFTKAKKRNTNWD